MTMTEPLIIRSSLERCLIANKSDIIMWITYAIIFVVLIVLELIYFKIADKLISSISQTDTVRIKESYCVVGESYLLLRCEYGASGMDFNIRGYWPV